MLGNFNFFEKKLKSVDNSKRKTNNFLDLRFSKEKNMLNNNDSSFILNYKRKKSKFLGEDISNNSSLKFKNSTNRRSLALHLSPKYKRYKKSMENHHLFDINKKVKKNSAINKKSSLLIKSYNKSSKNNIIYNPYNDRLKISTITPNNKDNINSIESFQANKPRFLELNNQRNEFYGDKIGKTPKVGNCTYFNNFHNLYTKYVKDYFQKGNYKRPESTKILVQNTNINNMDYFQNNLKILQLNEHIQNEIDSYELKKKIKLMKKSILIQRKSTKKLIIEEENISQLEDNENVNDNINIKNKEIISEKKEESQSCLKKGIDDNINHKDKYRRLKRIKELYDSFDDEEYEDDSNNEYYISPSSSFVKIFDCLIFLSSMFYLIFVPYFFTNNSIITGENKIYKLILVIIDFIYIIDIILNFFRAYQNFDENLIIKTKYIFIHYIRTWFFIDFLECIPLFTFFKYFEKAFSNDKCFSNTIQGKINPLLYLIILIKIIKVYKLINENSTIERIAECLTQNEIIDNCGNFFISIFFSLCFLNLCACLFIFLGKNSYPGWIMKINIQDESYLNIYITSLYFILVTITTVGYGDITGDSYPEIMFQMFLLIIGTIAYSFIISYISNYIVKINQKSMTFQKNVKILEEIRLQNPHLKNSIYKEVLKNLHNEQLYERKDKSFLFDCLPYTIKNKLIMEIYKYFIYHFIFFRDIENSDFIVKVVTSLKPLLAFKGDILIQEGDFVKEIFFVKKGVLSLNIIIDKDNQEESIKKYLNRNEFGSLNISYEPESIISNFKRKNQVLTQKFGKNIQEIKVIEIRKNEHFGVALMFLDERCPLVVKIKTKTSELLVLRKIEAIEIYSVYPNIWNRINKKTLFNLEQIKNRIKTKLLSIAKKYVLNEASSNYKRSKFMESLIHISPPITKFSNNKISNNSIKELKEEEKYNKKETDLSLEEGKKYNKSQLNAFSKTQIKQKLLTQKMKSHDSTPKYLNAISNQSSMNTLESESKTDISIEINNLTKSAIDQREDTNKSLSTIFNSNFKKKESLNKESQKKKKK